MKEKGLSLLFLTFVLLVLSACSDTNDVDSVEDTNDVDSVEDTNKVDSVEDTNKVDSIEDKNNVNSYGDTSNTNSPYTEAELINDPSAPSTNPNDYNSNGEYVPANGPSDNPADYNFDGEYKPIEDMTEEEKLAELESFFYGQ